MIYEPQFVLKNAAAALFLMQKFVNYVKKFFFRAAAKEEEEEETLFQVLVIPI